MIRVQLFLSAVLLATISLAQLNSPESIAYHPGTQRYFISNTGSGTIAVMDSVQDITSWVGGLSNPAGIQILGDTVFCASLHEVRSYDVNTAELLDHYPVSGSGFLNDVTTDGEYLYVSDSQQGRILRISIMFGNVDTLVNTGVTRVNGLFYDADENRLLGCSMIQNAPIWQISLPEGEVTTLITTSFAMLDGITMDNEGYIYVSSNYVPGLGGNDNIYRWDSVFLSGPELVSSDHDGPADIFYDRINELLAVPNAGSNTIDLLDLSDTGIISHAAVPKSMVVGDVFPNPFNAEALLKFTLPHSSLVRAILYDVLGRQAAQLANDYYPAGEHELSIGSAQLSSGVYYLNIDASGAGLEMRRAVLLK